MAKQVTQEGPLEIAEPRAVSGTTQPMPAVSAHREPSYYLTRWAIVNRTLAQVDRVTYGRAGVVQRLFTYLLIGGTAAVVNLAMLSLLLYKVMWPTDATVHYIFANVVAYEVSILANFIPNDYFTFRHLAGHNRPWAVRCLRFHITSLSGVAFTFLVSGSLHFFLHLPPLIAQAIALIVAVAFNFTVHHLFTYRHTAEPSATPAA